MFQRLRIPLACAAALGLVLGFGPGPSAAAATAAKAPAMAGAPSAILPTTVNLPNGFQPEGIAIGALPFAFFGSRANGDLFRVNLITGDGQVFSKGPGTPSLGMKVDLRSRLFVAGGTGGDARVVNAITGDVLASYKFANAPTFVNDVILTGDAAWFTDSLRPQLYKVPLGRLGQLPAQAAVQTVPLTGSYVHIPGAFNANGISRTPDGKALLIVQTATGLVFRVDPATGVTSTVDLGGYLVTNGDGLLLIGRTLYAVQNANNKIAVFDLNAAGTQGSLVKTITDPRFDVPTTAAAFGNRLYLPNARFSTPPTPDTVYTANAVKRF
jgi:sugar lactone lactonase YvrE